MEIIHTTTGHDAGRVNAPLGELDQRLRVLAGSTELGERYRELEGASFEPEACGRCGWVARTEDDVEFHLGQHELVDRGAREGGPVIVKGAS